MSGRPRAVDSLRPDLPHHLGRIIRHCLEKDPEHRYQSTKDVRNELEDLEREQTAEQLSAVASEAASRPSKERRWQPLVVAVVILTLAALTWLLVGRLPDVGPTEQSPAQPSVAAKGQTPMIVVLPFQNLGAADDEYFTDGMTEEITSRLAGVSGLRVISRTSAMQYKENRPALRQIGEELGVDYVLEGSVRWAKENGISRVRITPQLIRVADDTHLWADSYDRVLEDVFAIQTEIASSVVEALGITLLEVERRDLEIRPTEDLVAYQAYLRGMDNFYDPDWSATKFLRAAEMFGEAVELDPKFALAHAMLSRSASVLLWEHWDDSTERRDQARQSAQMALDLAPELPQAHVARGCYYYYGERDYEGAATEFRKAQSQLPNDADVHQLLGSVLRRQGQWDESTTYLETATALDPRSPLHQWNLGFNYMSLRRYLDADRTFTRSIELTPDQERAYYFKAFNSLLWHGGLDRTRTILESMPTAAEPLSLFEWMRLELYQRDFVRARHYLVLLPPEFTANNEARVPRALWDGLLLQLADEPGKAREAYEGVVAVLETSAAAQPDKPYVHSNLGWAHAGLGHKEEAIREARRAVELLPVSRDAMAGPAYLEELAHVYAMVDAVDLALDQLELLLSTPCWFSTNLMRLDPRWDPLRGHPRFQALLEKYGQEG